MGFAKYQGTKEDHFGDLIEYVEIQDKIERHKRDETMKAKWFSTISGNTQYAYLNTNTLLKLSIKAYRNAADHYQRLTELPDKNDIDHMQLWQDLWMECSYRCVMSMDIPEEKHTLLLQVFIEKMLNLEGRTQPDEHVKEMRKNCRYERYMRNCFYPGEKEIPEYWKWLIDKCPNDKADLDLIAENYEEYYSYLSYYLYKKGHPISDSWVVLVEENKRIVSEIKAQIKLGCSQGLQAQCLRNPLYYE